MIGAEWRSEGVLLDELVCASEFSCGLHSSPQFSSSLLVITKHTINNHNVNIIQ